MLELRDVQSGYGETQVLHGLSFVAQKGKVLTILGRNGAGKSTTLKTIMGLLPLKAGEIQFDGKPLSAQTFKVANGGISYVPETRDIFPTLTVRENLEVAEKKVRGSSSNWTMERVLDIFPRLGERLENWGSQLSGGEQQMLAVARGLLLNPRLLILDEPTEGLAPIIVRQIHDKLLELKTLGLSMIIVEQNFGFATSLADDVVIVNKGEIVWSGGAEEVREATEVQNKWLGI